MNGEYLVGMSEIAAMAGVTRSAVANWTRRYSHFPQPIAVLACGSIWDRRDIEEWLKERITPGELREIDRYMETGSLQTPQRGAES